MPLGLPLLAWSRKIIILARGEGGCVFAVFFALFPEKGILDFIAHGSVQIFTVLLSTSTSSNQG